MSKNENKLIKINEEQQRAIVALSGAHLEAGAGSGKTFVIVEHLVELFNSFLLKNKNIPISNLRILTRNYFSGVVLMTFTNKAAAEIAKRVRSRILSITLENEKQILGKDLLDTVVITTIHGFCFRLIKQGFFSSVSDQQEIVSFFKFKTILRNLFDLTVTEKMKNIKDKNFHHFRILIKNERGLFRSVMDIFNDPQLRNLWQKPNLIEEANLSIDKFLASWLELNNLQALFGELPSEIYHEKFKKLAWFKTLKEFEEIRPASLTNLKDLGPIKLFFNNLKMLRGPSKNLGLDEVTKFYENLKTLRTFIDEYYESLDYFYSDGKSEFNEWLKLAQNVINEIDIKYNTSKSINFSDLEYITEKNLRDPVFRKLIAEEYHYFIIDEFQDTSLIQFKIIKNLIQEEYNRAYFVGDSKQSIYRFRGGELEVFNLAKNLSPLNLSLLTNYRSKTNVIKFNNIFFNLVLHNEFLHQIAPDNVGDGRIIELSLSDGDLCTLEKDKLLSSKTVNLYEAQLIVSQIKYLLNEGVSDIAILYKNLRPSQILIQLLIQENIGFCAQVKLSFSENPLVGIFSILSEMEYINYLVKIPHTVQDIADIHKFQWPILCINSYISLLEVDEKIDLIPLCKKYLVDIHSWGHFMAFTTFLEGLNFSFSNFTQELDFIDEICILSNESINTILLKLSEIDDVSISRDFRFGLQSDQIKIMTVHSSKGLQFNSVILAGIFTNGRKNNESREFGKYPGSLKWKSLNLKNQWVVSPKMILEKIEDNQKDLAESKRLFYVACTRAESQLMWCSFPDSLVKSQDLSWAYEFRKYSDFIVDLIQERKKISLSTSVILARDQIKVDKTPIIYRVPMGIFNKNLKLKAYHGQQMMMSELSVTKLTTIVQCPRKFYLKNICRISPEELKLFFSLLETKNKEKEIDIYLDPKEYYEFENNDYLDTHLSNTDTPISFSSLKRGVDIHKIISQYIKCEKLENLIDSSTYNKDKNLFKWIFEEIDKVKTKFNLESERPLKFSFFNMMISGTPDLILFPKENSSIEVWDFKTGQCKSDKQDHYWYQLMIYAMALRDIGLLSNNEKVILKLLFLDEKNILTKTLGFDVIDKKIKKLVEQMSDLSQVNLDHCSDCPYENLCKLKIQCFERNSFMIE